MLFLKLYSGRLFYYFNNFIKMFLHVINVNINEIKGNTWV